MSVVARVRREETVQRLRRAAGEERDDAIGDTREQRGDAPEPEPDEVGDREQEAEEGGQPRAPAVVGQLESDRVRRQLPGRADRLRVGIRIALGEEQAIGIRLGGVADAVGAKVAQPERHPPGRERREPAEQAADGRDAADRGKPAPAAPPPVGALPGAAPGMEARAEDPGEDQRRQREQDPKCDRPAPLRLRPRGQRHVDGVPGLAREPGIRVRDEEHVPGQVGHVADVAAEEPVQRLGQAAGDEGGEPARDRGEEDADRPEHDPDQMRDREQQPEQDRQARTPEIVRKREPDRMVVHGRESTMRERWRRLATTCSRRRSGSGGACIGRPRSARGRWASRRTSRRSCSRRRGRSRRAAC